MERKKRTGLRRLLALVALMTVMGWTAGCAASQSIGLSALLPAKEEALLPNEEQQVEETTGGASGGSTAVYVPESSAEDQEFVIKPADIPAEEDEEEVIVVDLPEQEAEGETDLSEGTGSAVPEPSDTDVQEETAEETDSGNVDPDAPAVDQEQKQAALTFDDGPDAKYTTAILDILKEKGVKATFFVVGSQVEKYPDVMKRIIEEGHAVGNHTQGHKNLRELGKSGILEQMTEADEAIEDAVGFTPELFRAPYGAVSDTLTDVLEENDRRLVGWTVDTRDWAGTSIADMREMIRTKTEANGIILMHSFGGKHIRNTVEALPAVIDDLQELGFTLVTVDQIEE
ncbi:polysaccharide deacetylase family protein [Paenibacillus nanensis]|uniref:Polysaccharide deacetylase family protein n=1 Tax=Paenibacillus nanensis TaxID=393251 RepID=A0A3A1VL78_9BACL|nr:polysaccharide deacetylase family protein [Paenibacillus nanensis]RIX60522.1 polysaccharide deacetylase family protein [Paenibacillus nanensis]